MTLAGGPRFGAARDANEEPIVKALRKLGCSVVRLDTPCDLLVGFHGVTALAEIKLPLGPKGGKSGRDLTKAQADFRDGWRGSPLEILRSQGDCISFVERLGKRRTALVNTRPHNM